jgi:hypothetical protein
MANLNGCDDAHGGLAQRGMKTVSEEGRSDANTLKSTPIICHMARRVGVSVSIASVKDWSLTPRIAPDCLL